MPNPWFRFYHEFADDPKVQMLSEAYQRRLVMILCLRCKDETLQDCYIAFQLRVTETVWVETKTEFMRCGFIDKDNNILNWDKRQYTSDSSTVRVRKHRENKKQGCNVTVTSPDAEQKQKQSNKKKESKDKSLDVFSFSGEAFEGEVIKLSSHDFGLLFNQYSHDGNETKFRSILEKRDNWYSTQPYKTYSNWLTQTTKWLAKNKHEFDT